MFNYVFRFIGFSEICMRNENFDRPQRKYRIKHHCFKHVYRNKYEKILNNI